jgi:hypothetical protein
MLLRVLRTHALARPPAPLAPRLARLLPACAAPRRAVSTAAMASPSAPLAFSVAVSVDVEGVISAARDAAAVILRIYDSATAEWDVQAKADDSPLTRADKEANDLICGATACWECALLARECVRCVRVGVRKSAAQP